MTEHRGDLIVVRGAGDLATGVIARLMRSGFAVIALETARPTAIRRTVAFSEAIYEGETEVELLRARSVASAPEALRLALDYGAERILPLLVDEEARSLDCLRPRVLVDAIMAKRNLGSRIDQADIVIALGPGFTAGQDVHAVIETNRGHDLGRVIYRGRAEADTGMPGMIGGKAAERVVHAPASGVVQAIRGIGDQVRAGEAILELLDPQAPLPRIVTARIDGMLRGLIRSGLFVPQGCKIADVDPRGERAHCDTISDKAMAIAGGVLEAVLALGARPADIRRKEDSGPGA